MSNVTKYFLAFCICKLNIYFFFGLEGYLKESMLYSALFSFVMAVCSELIIKLIKKEV